MLKQFFKNEDGQGMVEYGLIIALIAVVVIVALTVLGGKVRNTLGNAGDKLGDDADTKWTAPADTSAYE